MARRWGVAVSRDGVVVGVNGHYRLRWVAAAKAKRHEPVIDVDRGVVHKLVVVRRSSAEGADWGLTAQDVAAVAAAMTDTTVPDHATNRS